jgi:hypothetical protein
LVDRFVHIALLIDEISSGAMILSSHIWLRHNFAFLFDTRALIFRFWVLGKLYAWLLGTIPGLRAGAGRTNRQTLNAGTRAVGLL